MGKRLLFRSSSLVAVRTDIPSRIPQQYNRYCEAIELTLFRILEVCAASKQKSLQGLDYIAKEGLQAPDTLEEVV